MRFSVPVPVDAPVPPSHMIACALQLQPAPHLRMRAPTPRRPLASSPVERNSNGRCLRAKNRPKSNHFTITIHLYMSMWYHCVLIAYGLPTHKHTRLSHAVLSIWDFVLVFLVEIRFGCQKTKSVEKCCDDKRYIKIAVNSLPIRNSLLSEDAVDSSLNSVIMSTSKMAIGPNRRLAKGPDDELLL